MESEYTRLLYVLREAIPIIKLLKEVERFGLAPTTTKAKMMCKVFEDNSGALEMAWHPKYQPCTKHINVKLHHFRDYVERGDIIIKPIDTTNQLANYLTKPVKIEIL